MDRRLPVSEIYERLVVDRRTVDALWEELESRSLAAALRERFAGIVRVRR